MVSVLINPSGGFSPASVTFPTQQDLENRKIVAISAYSVDDMTNDPNNPGVATMTAAVFKQSFLTLYTAAVRNRNVFTQHQEPGLFYDKIPLSQLRNVWNNDTATATRSSGSPNLFLIRPTEITFNKTKIEFPTPVAMANPMSAVLMFHYLDKGDDGTFWLQAMGFPMIKQ